MTAASPFSALELLQARRITELEAALRDVLEGVGAFTVGGWLADTVEVVRARAVLEDE